MDEVRYAERPIELDELHDLDGRAGADRRRPVSAEPPASPETFEARAYDGDADVLSSLMHRAVGEQIAEQRLIREALADFDHRLELIEHSIAERLVQVDHLSADRIDAFERSVSERMAAFEAVLRRIVDRLTGAEERVTEGLAHNDRMTRVQLDSLRPVIEAVGERTAELVEQSEEMVAARLESVHKSIEAVGERTAERVEQSEEAVAARLDALHKGIEGMQRGVEAAGERTAERVEQSEEMIAARLDALHKGIEGMQRGVEAAGERTAERLEQSEEVVSLRLDKLHGAVDAIAARIADALEITDRRVGSIEGSLDAAVERVSGEIAHSDRLVQAQIDALRPTIEASVLASVGPELDRTLQSFRDALADHAKRVTRDVNRLGFLMQREGQPVAGFEPVTEAGRDAADEGRAARHEESTETPRIDTPPRRRRERPLRAHRIPIAELVDDDE